MESLENHIIYFFMKIVLWLQLTNHPRHLSLAGMIASFDATFNWAPTTTYTFLLFNCYLSINKQLSFAQTSVAVRHPRVKKVCIEEYEAIICLMIGRPTAEYCILVRRVAGGRGRPGSSVGGGSRSSRSSSPTPGELRRRGGSVDSPRDGGFLEGRVR